MNRTAVRSRDIAIVGYDPETSTLEITFRIGGVYRYFEVPVEAYQALMSSPSQGKYFDQHIKYSYRYEKVR